MEIFGFLFEIFGLSAKIVLKVVFWPALIIVAIILLKIFMSYITDKLKKKN